MIVSYPSFGGYSSTGLQFPEELKPRRRNDFGANSHPSIDIVSLLQQSLEENVIVLTFQKDVITHLLYFTVISLSPG